MKLSKDLVQRIEAALTPIDGEVAQHIMLGRHGRIAMSTIQQYKTAQETLEVTARRADNGTPLTKQRLIAALQSTMNEEVVTLERRLRELSKRTDNFEGFDPAALAGLADEVNKIIGPQYKGRA